MAGWFQNRKIIERLSFAMSKVIFNVVNDMMSDFLYYQICQTEIILPREIEHQTPVSRLKPFGWLWCELSNFWTSLDLTKIKMSLGWCCDMNVPVISMLQNSSMHCNPLGFSCAFVYYDHNNGLWNQLDICFKCNLHLVGHFRRSRAHFEWQWELIFICFRKSVCKSVSRMLTVWLTIILCFHETKAAMENR